MSRQWFNNILPNASTTFHNSFSISRLLDVKNKPANLHAIYSVFFWYYHGLACLDAAACGAHAQRFQPWFRNHKQNIRVSCVSRPCMSLLRCSFNKTYFFKHQKHFAGPQVKLDWTNKQTIFSTVANQKKHLTPNKNILSLASAVELIQSGFSHCKTWRKGAAVQVVMARGKGVYDYRVPHQAAASEPSMGPGATRRVSYRLPSIRHATNCCV